MCHSSEPSLSKWLRRLAADHDGAALIVAKTVGSLMIEDGPGAWFKLSRICDLTGQSDAVVAGILYRLSRRGRLHFKRRDDRHDGIDPEFRFTIPTKSPEVIERARVWLSREDHFGRAGLGPWRSKNTEARPLASGPSLKSAFAGRSSDGSDEREECSTVGCVAEQAPAERRGRDARSGATRSRKRKPAK
jgi:hypothetical protein